MKEQKVIRFNYKVLRTEPIENLVKYKNKRRLSVFYYKGIDCANPKCNRKGTQIVHGIDRNGNVHIDICNDDFYPMTVDHIVPRSKGGSNTLDNMQPMCCECNIIKGDNMPGKEKGTFKESPKSKQKPKRDILKSKKFYYKPTIDKFKVGDHVYIGSGRKIKELGEIIEIIPNEKHPKKALSARIKEENYESLYSLERLWYKKK